MGIIKDEFDIRKYIITDIRNAPENGSATSIGLVLKHPGRISKLDRGIDGINSVPEISPDAIHIAEAVGCERPAGKCRKLTLI